MNDTIYRQVAIDAINTRRSVYSGMLGRGLSMAVDTLRDLPSAQPEIIRCKECKWKQGSECVRFADVRPFPDDFCSRAEGRTDEGD